MATLTISMSSFIIILTLFQTLSTSMATIQLPHMFSSDQSTLKLPHYSGLKLIRPLAASIASNGVAPVTDGDFESLVLNSKTLVLVEFWAEWCGPCRIIIDPMFRSLANDYEGMVEFYKLNVDENRSTPIKYHIRNLPSVGFYKNGKMIDIVVGIASKGTYSARIQKYL